MCVCAAFVTVWEERSVEEEHMHHNIGLFIRVFRVGGFHLGVRLLAFLLAAGGQEAQRSLQLLEAGRIYLLQVDPPDKKCHHSLPSAEVTTR